MAEEICFLSVLVDEFCADFSPAPNALALYKTVSFVKPLSKVMLFYLFIKSD